MLLPALTTVKKHVEKLETVQSKAPQITTELASVMYEESVRDLDLFSLGQTRKEVTGQHFSNTLLSRPLANRKKKTQNFSMCTEARVKLQEDLRYWILGEACAVRGVKHLILQGSFGSSLTGSF